MLRISPQHLAFFGGCGRGGRYKRLVRLIGPRFGALASGFAICCTASQRARAQTDASPPAETIVEVRGVPRGAGTPALSRAQARELPGAFGDPLRAVDSL